MPRIARRSIVLLVALSVVSPARAQVTTRVSVDSSGTQGNGWCDGAALSGDGRYVAFASSARNLVAGDTNGHEDVFVHDRTTGITERVSVDSSGAQGDGMSINAAISSDGSRVAFSSYATNLDALDTNGVLDVFVHDRSTGVTERISLDSSGNQGGDWSDCASLSSDGRFVAFTSAATNLVAGDTNGADDVFVRDRAAGTTERVSVDGSGGEGDGESDSGDGAISGDGNVVAFSSFATNLVAFDRNGWADVFVRDRAAGTTVRASVASNGAEAGSTSAHASLSADGKVVAFWSLASNLVPGDTNVAEDVFVHELATSLTERVSVSTSGAEANDWSCYPSLSADGSTVAFMSYATNLVTGDTNRCDDVFVRSRAAGVTERVSVATSGVEGDSHSGQWAAPISADGGIVAFPSRAANLVAHDTNQSGDTFVRERCTSPASWSNYGTGVAGSYGVPSFTARQNPVLGTSVTLDLGNSLQAPTVGMLFVGFQRADWKTSFGGDLLVVPAVTLPVTFSYGDDSFNGDIPDDALLCGVTIDLQALESDPLAVKFVSFTPGLELVLGR
jgi:Tol biopolymer transport system component